ncbi:MAG TPA: efflux RND transporter periplasmic adaptor subunit, partial [Methyloceanibacter sp.]|nr:efflux RND transporter periplasmic adaptor subunit [Methyloceanibacter sp.]
MQKASGKKGYSLGRRLVLIAVLLAVMILLPVVWHPAEEIMQSETAGPKDLATGPVKPVAAKTEKAPAKSVPVEAATVAKGPLTERVTAVGSLRSDESVVISSEIAGRIIDIHFKEGTPVERGAPLITLDDSVYQAELHQAEAKRLLAEQSNQRVTELFTRKIASASSRDEAESNLAVANAAMELARAQIEKTKIVAPFSGIVGLRQVSVGEYITPGQALVGLDAIDRIKVD